LVDKAVLDSFLPLQGDNEEKMLTKRFLSFYAQKSITSYRRDVWKLLLREFRRFILDFSEAKYLQNMDELNTRFKKAGRFQEKKDKRVFTRAMMSFQTDTYHMRTFEPFDCQARDKYEMAEQGKILLDVF